MVRVRTLSLPDHRTYFLHVAFGPHRTSLCEGDGCRGAVPWVYSPRALGAMRTFGTRAEAFIHAPDGRIWAVAGGRIDARKLLVPGTDADSPATKTALLTARLTPAAVTTGTTGVHSAARGRFSATVWPFGTRSLSLTAHLTTRRLTGTAIAAHIHTGTPGRRGPVLVQLCSAGRCKLSAKTIRGLPESLLSTIRVLGGYVDVHTKPNPRGELRGQIAIESG